MQFVNTGRGEEKGSQSYAGNEYATPAFPDKHRHLFPPPTYALDSGFFVSRIHKLFCANPCSRNSWTAYLEIKKKNTGIGYRYTYSLEHLIVLPQKVCFQSLELFVVTLLTHHCLVDPNVDLFAGMKKKKKKVTVADTEETPEPSPAPAVETPAPVAAAPVAEAEAKTEAPAPVATPEPSAEQPVDDSGDLFADLKKKKKKKKDIPLDLVRFFFLFKEQSRILTFFWTSCRVFSCNVDLC